jgi:hypothetical protein
VGYFINISITTPIAPALKNYCDIYLELSRSPSGYFKPLLDLGGVFTSETAARYVSVPEAKRLPIYSGYM